MPTNKKTEPVAPAGPVPVLSMRPGLVHLAKNGEPKRSDNVGLSSFVTHTTTLVIGPNAVSAEMAAEAKAFGEDVLVGEEALTMWRMTHGAICETAQSVPGLRLFAELDNDPARKRAALDRAEALRAG